MLPKGMLSKIGGGVSLISLLLLPMVKGCGRSLTGVDVLRVGDIPVGLKILLVIAILCAITAFFLKTALAFFFSGSGGLVGLLGAYTMARQKFPVELEIGTYLAIIGFGAILVEGFLQRGDDKGNIAEVPPDIKEEGML